MCSHFEAFSFRRGHLSIGYLKLVFQIFHLIIYIIDGSSLVWSLGPSGCIHHFVLSLFSVSALLCLSYCYSFSLSCQTLSGSSADFLSCYRSNLLCGVFILHIRVSLSFYCIYLKFLMRYCVIVYEMKPIIKKYHNKMRASHTPHTID